jgi:hypothetical protein
MSELPTLTGLKHTFKSLQDVDADPLIPNYVLKVNNDGSKIEEVSASSIILPAVGSGTTNHIPIFSGGFPPIFNDSGVEINTASLPPYTAKLIDFQPANPLNTVIGVSEDGINPPILVMGTDGLMLGNGGGNVAIFQGDTGPNHFIAISNQGADGVVNISSDYIGIDSGSTSGTITLSLPDTGINISNGSYSYFDSINENYISMTDTGFSLSQGNNTNGLNMSAGGTYISNTSGNQIAITPTGCNLNDTVNSNSLNMGVGGINISNNGGDTQLSLSSGITSLNSKFNITLNQTNQGHFIQLANPTGINIAANSLQPLSLNTDGNLTIKANSSTGSANQVLMASGSGNCNWQTITPTITVKQGTKDNTPYTTTSNTFVDVDLTNLSYTVNIPTGYKMTVQSSAPYDASGASDVSFGIYDSVAVGIVSNAGTKQHAAASNADIMDLIAIINGDDASHTIKLQYAVSAGTLTVSNSSSVTAGAFPTGWAQMIFRLEKAL